MINTKEINTTLINLIFILYLLPIVGISQANTYSPAKIDSILENTYRDTSISFYQKTRIGEKLIKWSDQTKYAKGKYNALLETGLAHFHLSQYEKALANFQNSYMIAQEMDSTAYIAEAVYFLGTIHKYLDNFDQAKEYFEESLGLYAHLKNIKWMAAIKSNLGTIYAKKENYLDALAAYQEALSLMQANNLEKESSIPLANIGDNYWRMKKPELALKYFKQSLALDEKYGMIEDKAISLANMGLAYRDLKRYDLAFQHFEQSLSTAKKYQYRKLIYENYKELSTTYKEIGNNNLALEYFEKFHILKDSIFNQEKNKQISNLSVAYETEKKELELVESKKLIETLEQSQKINRLSNYLIMVSVLSLLILGFLFFSRQKARRELIETQLKNKQLESQNLKKELKYKEQDLTNFALDITRKNEFSNSIYESLKEIISIPPQAAKKKARELLMLTSNHLKINDDIEQFQMNIDKVNQEYFDKLQQQFPNLTNNDKQLCGLIRLNLSIKEIATIRNISPKSVEMSRYRLRKKLALDKGEDMTQFLQSF